MLLTFLYWIPFFSFSSHHKHNLSPVSILMLYAVGFMIYFYILAESIHTTFTMNVSIQWCAIPFGKKVFFSSTGTPWITLFLGLKKSTLSGVALPKGPGGPGPHHFLTFLKVKAYVGPTIFLVTQWPIINGPHQKRNYTPAFKSSSLLGTIPWIN